MSTSFKLLLAGLLLLLLAAVGTEVIALHRPPGPAGPPAVPVVVRKSATAPQPPKAVRPVRPRPSHARRRARPPGAPGG